MSCHSSNFFLQETTYSNTILLNIFSSLNERYFSIYNELIINLEQICIKLVAKYGEDDAKVKILKDKIWTVREEIQKSKQDCEVIKTDFNRSDYSPCDTTMDFLQKKLWAQTHHLKKNSRLTEDEEKFCSYRNESSFSTYILKFFGIKPASTRELNTVLKKTNTELNITDEEVSHNFKFR